MGTDEAEVGDAADRLDLLLFWYCNEEKVEALHSQLNGRLETERKETVSRGGGKTGRLGLKIGSLLAALGLAGADVEGEVRSDYERILEVTTSLTAENKAALLLAYLRTREELLALELFEGSPADLLRAASGSRFGIVSGLFRYVEVREEAAELRSVVRVADADEPVCRVPLTISHFNSNQAINVFAYDDSEPWPHEVFAELIVRPGWILANPIAAWLPHVDGETELVKWTSGSDTAQLDEATGMPAAGI